MFVCLKCNKEPWYSKPGQWPLNMLCSSSYCIMQSTTDRNLNTQRNCFFFQNHTEIRKVWLLVPNCNCSNEDKSFGRWTLDCVIHQPVVGNTWYNINTFTPAKTCVSVCLYVCVAPSMFWLSRWAGSDDRMRSKPWTILCFHRLQVQTLDNVLVMVLERRGAKKADGMRKSAANDFDNAQQNKQQVMFVAFLFVSWKKVCDL